MLRHRGLGLLASAGLIAVYVSVAATSSPWWRVFVVLSIGVFAAQLWMPGHLRRRVALLTADVGAG